MSFLILFFFYYFQVSKKNPHLVMLHPEFHNLISSLFYESLNSYKMTRMIPQTLLKKPHKMCWRLESTSRQLASSSVNTFLASMNRTYLSRPFIGKFILCIVLQKTLKNAIYGRWGRIDCFKSWNPGFFPFFKIWRGFSCWVF